LKCADCPASSFAEREWHARDNPDFLLLGQEHGFVVAGADSTADADDVAGDDAAAEGAAHAMNSCAAVVLLPGPYSAVALVV
jgi:hypothetical protein